MRFLVQFFFVDEDAEYGQDAIGEPIFGFETEEIESGGFAMNVLTPVPLPASTYKVVITPIKD